MDAQPPGPVDLGVIQFTSKKRPAGRADPFEISRSKISRDTLHLTFSYSGGCEDHEFVIFCSGKFTADAPFSTDILISHDAHNDTCEAMISEEVIIDIAPIKNVFRRQHPKEEARSINLAFPGKNRNVSYEF